jgi:hypothetical protein
VTPPSAVERSAGQAIPLSWAAGANVPPALARTVMAALSQLPDSRPHSAEEFRRRIDASLALGAPPMTPRVDQRAQHTPWPAPDPTQPQRPAAPTAPPPQHETPLFEEEALVTATEGPSDRMRRLLRLVLGAGGAAAGALLLASLLGGRDDDDWAGAGVVSAQPTSVAKSRPLPSAAAEPPAVKSPPLTAEAPASSRSRPPEPVFMQASADLSRGAVKPAAAPSRSRTSTAEHREQDATRGVGVRAPAASTSAPPSITLSLPPTVGQFELLPPELLTELRERLAHGREITEYGQYAAARRIYRAALDRIDNLGDRYVGSQALLFVKQELEQASERALAACTAENDVIRKRSGRSLPCE